MEASPFETYAVQCGAVYFIYMLNNSDKARSAQLVTQLQSTTGLKAEFFNPETRQTRVENVESFPAQFPTVALDAGKDVVVILSPANSPTTSSPNGNKF